MEIGFVPLIEEIAFRGWLSGRKAALGLAAIGLACISVGAVVAQVAPRAAGNASLCAVAVFVIASFYWMAAQRKPQEMLPWFRRHYATVVWLSSLAFGAIHLTNYEGVPRLIDVFLI